MKKIFLLPVLILMIMSTACDDDEKNYIDSNLSKNEIQEIRARIEPGIFNLYGTNEYEYVLDAADKLPTSNSVCIKFAKSIGKYNDILAEIINGFINSKNMKSVGIFHLERNGEREYFIVGIATKEAKELNMIGGFLPLSESFYQKK